MNSRSLRSIEKDSSAIHIYRILGFFAIVHSALVLCALLVAIAFDRTRWYNNAAWVALASLWLLWPVVLALHPGRSLLRFSVPVLVSLLLLAPCVRFYARSAPQAFDISRMPTLEKPIIVRSENLGSGFRHVSMEEFVTGGFEGVYHGDYLFYRERKLAYFSSASLAPSRQFAIYFDLGSDRLVLFRVADQMVIQLLQDPVTDFEGFEWNEAAGYVALRSSGGQLRTFSLK